MKNTQSEIFCETNYERFSFHPNNRPIETSLVKEREKSIDELDMTHLKPVIVNERMQIIDGQHTYMACKNLGKPIYYVRAALNGKSNDAMQLLNDNQKAWTTLSWIHHWAKRGKEDYQMVIDCMVQHRLSVGLSLLFVGQAGGTAQAKILREGKFKHGSLGYNTLVDIYNDFKTIFPNANHVGFCRALVNVIKAKKYNHKNDFYRFEKQRYDLQICANLGQYYKMFERILNWHRRADDKIKIELAE